MSTIERRLRTILIVDDIEDNRVLLERALQSAGYRTVLAESGAAALAHMSQEKPDLVLLDWMMPGLTGMETLRAIRETYPTSHLPVIMCTAMGEEDNVVEALEAGANDYVVKPISLPVLRARMSAHLAQSETVSALDTEKQETKRRMAEQMRRLMEVRSPQV